MHFPVTRRRRSRGVGTARAFRSGRLAVAVGLVVALIAAGCSGAERGIQDYSPVQSEQMLKVGLSDIQKIYIRESAVSDLAVAGLQGLQRIDPEMSVDRSDKLITLRIGNRIAGEAVVPAQNDAYTWATVVSKLLHDGRTASSRLSQARTEEIYAALFDSVASKLDPYSRYSSAHEALDNRAQRDGFGGIGVTLVPRSDSAEINEVIPGLPADLAGLRSGDRILAVDGRPVGGLDSREIIRILQGPVGVSVYLTVASAKSGGVVEVPVLRAHITPQTVFYRKEGDVAVIEVTSFNAETTTSVRESFLRAEREIGPGIQGVVLDLRDNPGGLLQQAVRVADLFLDSGVIVTTRGRHRDSQQFFAATAGDITNGLPIVVLLNGGSASAAEILASALQDHGRAVVVGSTSFGKGTVQTVLRMPNDGELILTWALLHAPSGYSLNGTGVMPTICTHNGIDATVVLQSALGDNGSAWRSLLRSRRNFDHLPQDQRERVKAFCPGDTTGVRPALDIEVATALLAAQRRYFKAVTLARIGNSH